MLKITKGGRSAEQNHFSTATEHRLAQDFVAVGIKPGSHRIQRARILVVEDDAELAAQMAQALAAAGFSVDVEADGDAASFAGSTEAVVTEERLRDLYELDFEIARNERGCVCNYFTSKDH